MLEVTSLDHEGRGIARLDNKIVFIKNALPGEIIEPKILKQKKKYIEADVKRYIKLSDKRINDKIVCPYFKFCGGCDLLHLSYNDQLNFKQEKIKNILKKYVNPNLKINNIIESDNIFNYRNKISFQVKQKIGFYKENTYDIIGVDKCRLANALINNSIEYLKRLDLKYINKIICRTGSNKLMIIIDTNKKDLNIECIKKICSSIYLKINNKYTLIYGDKDIYINLDKYKFIISPDSFFQINENVCLKLYNKIKAYVGINKYVLDLYCGTGSIGIFVSKKNKVTGIEINKYAIDNANTNKIINKINNINFICGDSEKNIKNIKIKPNVVIVDPPRSGLSIEALNSVMKLNAQKLIYVSCDPMTLSRDLRLLSQLYDIEEVTPFDMFPNTKHIECVALLNFKFTKTK